MVPGAGPQHNVPTLERNGNNRSTFGASGGDLKEIARSTDPVRLSFLTALLSDGGIPAVLFDTHASIVQGSLGVLPQRLMVADEDFDDAVALLKTADQWEEPDKGGWL
jgi:hypothetical protein